MTTELPGQPGQTATGIVQVNAPTHVTEHKPSLIDRIRGTPQRTEISPQIFLQPRITVTVNDKPAENMQVTVEDAKPVTPTDPMAGYRVQTEPYYLPSGGERELFASAYQSRLPMMLKGPTGSGKTRLVEHMAHRLNLPLVTVSCNEDTRASDLVGRIMLNGSGTYFQDGPLTQAARHGGIAYLDEVVEARSDAMVLIHSLTDHRRILPIDKTGEVVQAHPNFLLVVSYNPHYQSSLKEMKQSTRQRFVGMELGYLEPGAEAQVVAHESGVGSGTARMLVDLAGAIRDLKKEGLAEGASTRLLVYTGQLIASGVDAAAAVRTGIVNPITDDLEMQQRMMKLARQYVR